MSEPERPCTYCGCDVERHAPVYVYERDDAGERVQSGRFCNYGCLAAHVEDADLAVGTTCEWSPDGEREPG